MYSLSMREPSHGVSGSMFATSASVLQFAAKRLYFCAYYVCLPMYIRYSDLLTYSNSFPLLATSSACSRCLSNILSNVSLSRSSPRTLSLSRPMACSLHCA